MTYVLNNADVLPVPVQAGAKTRSDKPGLMQRFYAALVVSREPRGYSPADHERAEALRDEAASMRRLAAAKTVPSQRRLVEQEAANLERDADAIVPLEHARAGWR